MRFQPTSLSGITARLLLSIFILCIPSLAQSPTKPGASFQQLADDAARASAQNRLDEAVSLYSRALAIRPRWAEGWWSLGTIEYDRDQYANAARSFTKLIALQPNNGTAHAMLGLSEFELGQDSSALRNLTLAENLGVLQNDQLHNVALYHLAVLQLRSGQFGDARTSAVELVKKGVKTQQVMQTIGAAALLRRSPSNQSETPEAMKAIEAAGEAETLLQEKDFDRAREKYAEIAAGFPDFPNLHFAFGRALLALNQPDQAIAEFQLELKNDPRHVRSLLEIAAVRYRTDSPDGLKYAQQAVSLAPNLPFAHYLLGLLYNDTQDFPNAVTELELAEKSFKNKPEIYYALGNAYSGVGRKQDAIRARAIFRKLEAQRAQKEAEPIDSPITNIPSTAPTP